MHEVANRLEAGQRIVFELMPLAARAQQPAMPLAFRVHSLLIDWRVKKVGN